MTFAQFLAITTVFAAVGQCDIVKAGQMPDVFQGQQTGIGSWYQADSQRDSTNGKSWCGYAYQDDSPLFAPSLKLMGGATWGSNPDAWKEQTAKFCGLEAKVTDPDTGKTQLMYIGDSFAQPRSDGSIDIMLGPFTSINGDPKQDKDTVIKNVQWELTGNQNTEWMAPSANGATNGASGSDSSSSSSSSSSGGGKASNSSSADAGSQQNNGSDGAAPTTLQTVTKTASAHGHKKTSTGDCKSGKDKDGDDDKE